MTFLSQTDPRETRQGRHPHPVRRTEPKRSTLPPVRPDHDLRRAMYRKVFGLFNVPE